MQLRTDKIIINEIIINYTSKK